MADESFFGSAGEKTIVTGAVKEMLYKEASLRQLSSLSLSLLLLFVFVYSSSLKRITIVVSP